MSCYYRMNQREKSLVLKVMNDRKKERSELINLARRHGGRTAVDHAGIGNISLSTKPFVSQKPNYRFPET